MTDALKIHMIGLVLILLSLTSMAQTDLLFSNSGMNATIYNPAVIENNGMINFQALVRRQWVGFPDAPSVEQFHAGTFFDNRSMGVKLSVVNQTLGKEVTRRLNAAYAYKVYFDPNMSLNLGLSAGFYQRQILFSQMVFLDGTEPLSRTDESYFKPDFEFGFQLNAYDFGFGYAANHLSTTNQKVAISTIPIHHHLYGFYLHSFNDENKVRAGLSWHQQGEINFVQADVQFLLGKLQTGLGFRVNDALILKAGLVVSETVEVAYAYDIGIYNFANYNSGSHEFVLIVRLNRKSAAYLSPRFLDY